MNESDGNAMDEHFEEPAQNEALEAGGFEEDLPPLPASVPEEGAVPVEPGPVESAAAEDVLEPDPAEPFAAIEAVASVEESASGEESGEPAMGVRTVDEAAGASAVEGDAPEGAAAAVGDAGEDEEEPLPPGVVRPPDEELVEALLFATPEPLTIKTIREIVDPEMTIPKLNAIIRGINKKMDAAGCAFEVVPAAAGYRFRTRPVYYPWVKKLFREQGARRLSQAALETLAVVAYKQPITKAEIEAVRGVAVDGALKTLLDRKLVSTTGRSDQPGKALTYGTTREFLQYFGIQRVPEDLPRLSEFEELVQSQSLVPQFRMGTLEERARDDA